jgi:hypothetical protein
MLQTFHTIPVLSNAYSPTPLSDSDVEFCNICVSDPFEDSKIPKVIFLVIP